MFIAEGASADRKGVESLPRRTDAGRLVPGRVAADEQGVVEEVAGRDTEQALRAVISSSELIDTAGELGWNAVVQPPIVSKS